MHHEGDLYVVMMQVGTVKGEPVFEPLGFGLPMQPSPEMLLRRGSRCTGFKREEEALEWLDKSAAKWNLSGLVFQHGKKIRIQKIEMYGTWPALATKSKQKPHRAARRAGKAWLKKNTTKGGR
jgi:hypothetical protein